MWCVREVSWWWKESEVAITKEKVWTGANGGELKISDFLSMLIALVNQMKTCDEGITNQHIVGRLMKSLT